MFKKTLFTLIFLLALPWASWAQADSPGDVVRQAVDGVIHVLKSRTHQGALNTEERDAIRQAVEAYFDFRVMAKLSLGKPWKKINKMQRNDFANVFRELIEHSYGNRLSEFHNQRVEYGKVKASARRATVNTEVIDADHKTPVRYSLRHTKKAGWRIYNIQIEGMSMVSTFRSDFTQAVQQGGFEGLMHSLQQRLAKMKKADEANEVGSVS